jgi:hypothetical protein
MRRYVTILALLAAVMGLGGAAFAVETKPVGATEPKVTEQKDSRKPVDNIIRVETVEDYWWHVYNFDPSVHYDVAPWLYDPFNLSRESGASGKD